MNFFKNFFIFNWIIILLRLVLHIPHQSLFFHNYISKDIKDKPHSCQHHLCLMNDGKHMTALRFNCLKLKKNNNNSIL